MTLNENEILRISSEAMFRMDLISLPRGRKTLGLHVRTLAETSSYELAPTEAQLFLHFNGIRSIIDIVNIFSSRSRSRIANAKTKDLIIGFAKNLVDLGLLMKSPKPTKDPRTEDMACFLASIKKSTPRRYKKKNTPRLQLSKSEQIKVFTVRKRFSGLLKEKVKVKVSKLTPPFAEGLLHLFSTEFEGRGKKSALGKITGSGVATTVEGAALASVAEALERHQSFDGKADLNGKSFEEMRSINRKALNPRSFQPYSPEQTIIKNHEVAFPSDKTIFNWVNFEDATATKRKILIPSDINGTVPISSSKASFLCEGTSNGCAADIFVERAKLRATLELIERDGVLFYWRTRNTPEKVDVSKTNERLGTLLYSLGPLRKRVHFFLLKTELAAVTAQAIFLGKSNLKEPLFVSTSASRLSASDAIEKALVELIYVLEGNKWSGYRHNVNYGRFFDNSIWGIDDHFQLYANHPLREAYGFLFPRRPKIIPFSELPTFETGDYKKNLEFLISDFRRNNLRLYFRNNTRELAHSVGFHVIRAFSPDLFYLDGLHRFRALGQRRYYTLPKRLGLKSRPAKSSELNPWPHPIP